MKRQIISVIMCLCCCSFAFGQLPASIELNSQITVTQDSTITARNQIWLKPGFRFTAQTGKALYLKIAAGRITVKHKDHDDNAPLSGGTFRVTNANNVLVGNYTVSNGQVAVPNLDLGTYTITEIAPPTGYDSIKTPRTITVSSNIVYETVYDYYKSDTVPTPPTTTGSITVKFRDSGTTALLNGRVKVKDSENVLIDSYELSNGEVTISNLDSGTYKVMEDIIPSGYQVSPFIRTATVTSGSNEEIIFQYNPVIAYTPNNADTIPLKFKLEVKRHFLDENDENDENNIEESVLYFDNKATRIGEYYWSQVFNDTITQFRWWTLLEFSESDTPPNDSFFDLYMPQIYGASFSYNPDIEAFNKYYGKYYNNNTIGYMNQWGSMLEGNATEAKAGWGIPYDKDYRQLFAMCPLLGTNTSLDVFEVNYALGARPGENPLAVNMADGDCNVYWFYDYNQNLYDFNMMPGGYRLATDASPWTNGLGYWEGPKGAFAHLFYTTAYATKPTPNVFDANRIYIHDRVDTKPETNADWINLRWCRRLTDYELGYKLYITAADSVRSSLEWDTLQMGNEIPLLNKILAGRFSVNDGFDIIKQDTISPPPTNSVELPNGYIRGFYVQYVLDKASPRPIPTIIDYATKVDDNVLVRPSNQNKKSKLPDEEENLNEKLNTQSVKPLTVYPNPVGDVLYIDSEASVISIKVYSSTGALVKLFENVDKSLDVTGLISGIYTFVVKTEKENATFRVMKK
ncbi:SpaA isopeptide-forming pilin-related protein [Viscerimonas tarda]